MPAKRRSKSADALCAGFDYTEVSGGLLHEAEWAYYGYMSGKFTQKDFSLMQGT